MAEINRIIKNARDVLVGKVPDPQSQIDQITLALIYKFMDAKDQDAVALGLKKTFFVDKFEEYSFTKIMQAASNEKQYELYQKGIDELRLRQDLPSTFISVFKDAFIPYRDALTLHLFLVEINKIPTDNTELLGTAFEDLLSIMGSQGDAGQFRTPRHIIDMIVEIVAPKRGERILDPACGTAGFLISAYNKVTQQELTVAEKDDLINNGLVGYDINPNMVKLSNVNLFLHGCQKPNIHLYDTLTEKDFWSDKYDVILANPPFMTPKGGIRPHELFSAINANRSEILFTYYITQHLKRNGRAGFIVPEGVVFQTANAYKEMRRILVDEGYLYAVISLPSGVFNPYSGVKTSILLLDKALAQKTDKVLFVKMNNDGFDLGAQRRPIDKNDIPQIVETVKSFAFNIETETETEFIDKEGASIVATKKQIKEKDYILVGDRYCNAQSNTGKWKYVQLGDKNLFQIESGGTPRTQIEEYWDGDINWATLADLPAEDNITLIKETERKISNLGLNNSSAYLLPINSILVSSRATIGRVGINKIPLATNQGFKNIIIKDFSQVDPMFLALTIKCKKNALEKLATGGTFKEFSKNAFMRFEIPLPPIEKQKEIVAEIEQYQKVIDGARQIIENYKPQISVEREWEDISLGEMCDILNGSTPSRTNNLFWNQKDIPWFTVDDIREQGRTIRHTRQFISRAALEQTSVKLLPPKTVLLCCTASVGEYAITEIPLTTNQQFNGLIIKDGYKDKVLPEYLFYYSARLKDELQRLGGTTAFKFVSVRDVRTINIKVPPIEDQIKIVERLTFERNTIDANKKLILLCEQKIKDVLTQVWDNN